MEPAHTTTEPLTSLGEFRIHAVLGAGGSGTVYDASWGPRRVALKVLHAALLGTGGTGPFSLKERVQFLAEAQRLQQIGHPSVVKVLAVGELPDGRPYLAMERLEGETLAALIARGALSLELALLLFGELCGAVSALHEQGLIHRDLKPENVYVVNQRHVVLLDFGIAKDLGAPASTTTQEGNVRGTPAYMAPERFFGQPAGLATDIYELALVLYAMLAGRLPWLDVADPEARLSPMPLTDVAAVPEALDIEIRRALSTRAQNRPASAIALLAVVRAATGIAAPEPGPGETAPLRSADLQLPAEQVTPLASAPTVAAPSSTATRRRSWSWIPVAVTAIAAVSVFLYVRIAPHAAAVGQNERDRASTQVPAEAGVLIADPNDPWSAKPARAANALPLVADASPHAAYRAAARAAITHLPADTNVVFAVQIDELHDNTATADVLHKLGTNPKVALVMSGLPDCIRTLAGTSEWMVFGSPELDAKQTGALIVGGRWVRKDVEACFDSTPIEVKDGSTLWKITDLGWLDFIDDHTAYLAMRPTFTAEQVHALAKRGSGLDASTRALLAKLPVDRSIVFAVSSKAKVNWASMLLLPNTSDVFGWARVGAQGMEIDAGADTHDAKAARSAAAVIRPQISDVFSSSEGAGKLVVALDGTEVHVRGTLTTFTLSMISSQIDR